MILQSLVRLYEALERNGKIAAPGWCPAKVSFALDISKEGRLLGVVPLKIPDEKGKKMTAQLLTVPQTVARASGISPNFLCDNSSYLLGMDNKGKPKRSRECFEASKARHEEILRGAESAAAKAVMLYFQTWKPEEAADSPALAEYLEEIQAGANLVFMVDGRYAQEDGEIKKAWQTFWEKPGDGEQGVCLVTGRRTEIARLHGLIRGVRDAQPSGAALVSFNAPAYESHGKTQSFNSPVGTYAVYAYTTALNYLLSRREHTTILGDTTIVYWSEDGGEEYSQAFSFFTEPSADNQEIVDGVFKNLRAGKAVVAADVIGELSLEQKFYILGLAPNAARIAVRFFYQDSFGNILKHIKEHYDRMEIVRPARDSLEYLGIWRMLSETVNKKSRDKKPIPSMAGSVYRAVISGSRYPESLYQAVLGRIRAEQDDADNRIYKITRGRAAIIKAFLMRNRDWYKEEITMGLNENSSNVAYTLGREFAVLEAIQEEANPGINATIRDRYFNSACATPAMVFPILFKLKNSHLRKMDNRGMKIYYEKMLGELQEKIKVPDDGQGAYPKRLSLDEQGMFILGYYHQTQKRYEKRTKEEA